MSVYEELVADQGFDCSGSCEASALKVREEVRAMCAADKCQTYDKSWACPPACGDIYEFESRMHQFDTCLVFQTVAQMEDDFDFEVMHEASELHKERTINLAGTIDEAGLSGESMLLSAGTCTLCAECTYPDAPCRFPDKRLVSMEAAGLVVSEVCTKAGIPYNHGPLTITYSSCVLY